MTENNLRNTSDPTVFPRSDNFRYDITIAQLNELYNMSPGFFGRARDKYRKQFVGQSLYSKFLFVAYCFYVVGRRLKIALTKKIANQSTKTQGTREGLFRIAVSCGGALGDMMHHISYLEKFYFAFAPFEMDFFVNSKKLDDRSKLAVSGLTFIREIISVDDLGVLWQRGNYDLHIDIKHVVKYIIYSKQRLADCKPDLLSLIEKAQQRFQPYSFIFDVHPRLDGLFGRLMAARNMNAAEASGYFGMLPVSREDKPSFCPSGDALLSAQRFGLSEKLYVTVHDGFEADKLIDANITPGERIMRAWPLEYWAQLVSLLKKKIPDILVVQIGVSQTSGKIEGVDVNLLDQTTLPEACWLIKNAALHIDTETGLIRVAWAMHTPTLSLQGPSGTYFFHFEGVDSVISSFCNDCYWVKEDWNTHCLRGFGRAECMYAIKPDFVASKAFEVIEKQQRHYVPAPSIQRGLEELLKDIGQEFSSEGKVLKVGGNLDHLTEHAIQIQKKVIVVSNKFSDDLMNCSKNSPHVELRYAHPLNLPVSTSSMDIVVSEYNNDHYAERELFRVVKAGGKVVRLNAQKTEATVSVKELI